MFLLTKFVFICVFSRAISRLDSLDFDSLPRDEDVHLREAPDRNGGGGITATPTLGPWSTWGRCSVSCGGGTQSRSRKSCTSRSGCSNNRISRKCNSHTCPVCHGEWTTWFDRDNPGGNGDYETLRDLRKERTLELCVSPSVIDARVVRLHTNWYQSGDAVTVSQTSGLSCVNRHQKQKRLCKDYEVRFCCPKIQNRKEVQFVATTFLKTILSVSGGGSKPAGPAGKPAPPPPRCGEHECVRENFEDTSQMVRMIGRRISMQLRQKRQADTQTGPPKTKRDILFIIDESGSVGNTNFKRFKRLIQAIIKTFCGDIDIGEQKTRVAVHSFDAKQHLHMTFKEYFSKAQVLTGIDGVAYDYTTDGATCLIEGLQYSRESLFTPERGARMQKPDTEQLLVLLSDGCANCKPASQRPRLLNEVAKKLSQQGIAILTFFVAAHSSSSSSCVDKMVALIDGSHCYQTFRAYSWDEVDVFADTIEAAGCSDGWKLTAPCPPAPKPVSSSRSTNDQVRRTPPSLPRAVPRRQAAPQQKVGPLQQALQQALRRQQRSVLN